MLASSMPHDAREGMLRALEAEGFDVVSEELVLVG
jgi:hypothetical protein